MSGANPLSAVFQNSPPSYSQSAKSGADAIGGRIRNSFKTGSFSLGGSELPLNLILIGAGAITFLLLFDKKKKKRK